MHIFFNMANNTVIEKKQFKKLPILEGDLVSELGRPAIKSIIKTHLSKPSQQTQNLITTRKRVPASPKKEQKPSLTSSIDYKSEKKWQSLKRRSKNK